MMEIEKPRITCEENENGTYAKFVVEPLERGYGQTIGNALRRTLLGALPGAAPIAIRINGVDHEFSTIKGSFLLIRPNSEIGYFIIHQRPFPPDDGGAVPG